MSDFGRLAVAAFQGEKMMGVHAPSPREWSGVWGEPVDGRKEMAMTTCTTCQQKQGFTTLDGQCPDCWEGRNTPASDRGTCPNPWIAVLTQPRRAIRQILTVKPNVHPLLITAAYGLLLILSIPQFYSLPIDRFVFFALCGLVGPVIALYVIAEAIWLVAGFMGGAATNGQLRATIVWSLFWPNILCTFPVMVAAQLLMAVLPSASGWLGWLPYIPSCYCLGLFTVCFAEVQRFSMLRAAICLLVVFLGPPLAFLVLCCATSSAG